MLIVNQVISVALMLCLRFWITSLLSLCLVILIHARFIHATWDFLWEVCSVVVLLVTTGNTTTKTRAFYGQSTSGSIARHALVLRWLVMIHYATTLTCYLLVNLPQIYLLFLSGNLYARSKSSKFFFHSCEKDNLWKNWQWT